MKILFLTNKVPYPPKDGGAIASLSMITAFAQMGHEVSVLAMNTRKHHVTPWEIPDEITNKMILHLVEVPAPITFRGAFLNLLFSKIPYNAERFIDKKYQTKLELLLNSCSYDIIQLEGLYMFPYVPVIRKNAKGLISYRSHNIEHEIWKRTTENTRGLKKLYLNILTKRMLKFETNAIDQYDLLVPITQRDASKLELMGNTKPCCVVPAGISGVNEPSITSFQMNLFFIGALDWAPNQEGLIWFIDKCFPLLKRYNAKIVFKIAGRNAPEWFTKKIRNAGIEFLGEIDDAPLFMKENGIMIVPLFSGSGMRVKIIEGMSYSKAIVSTSIGCEGIDAQNGKDIFIADDPVVFSNYIISLLSDKNKVINTGTNASKFVHEHYSNKILIKQLAEFYNLNLQ